MCPICWIIATFRERKCPKFEFDLKIDSSYPICILERQLAANRGCRRSGTPGCAQSAAMAAALNEANDRYIDLLERAIRVLRAEEGNFS